MKKVVAVVVLAAIGVLLFGFPARTARADQLGISVEPQNPFRRDAGAIDGGGLTIPEGEMKRRLESALLKAAEEVPGWSCLKAGARKSDGRLATNALEIMYDVRPTETEDLARGRVQAWEVTLWTRVWSKKPAGWVRKERYIFGDEYFSYEGRHSAEVGEEFVKQVIEKAVEMLRQSADEARQNGVNPCEITVTFSGEAVASLPAGTTITQTFQAETVLALDATGAFSITAPFRTEIVTKGGGPCQYSGSLQAIDPRVRAVGRYQADGTLQFTELTLSASGYVGERSITCVGIAGDSCRVDTRIDPFEHCSRSPASPAPVGTGTFDMLGGQSFTVALRDGERSAVPRSPIPFLGATSTLSLTLGYGGGTGEPPALLSRGMVSVD